jgi:hypothetical protein
MRTFLLLVLFIISGSLLAQTTLSGKVTDKKGEPLPGVNIWLKGFYDGTASDAEGRYEFTTSATGPHMLVARMVGFETVEIPVELAGSPLRHTLTLKEEFNRLEAVTITAGAFEASDEKKGTVLKPLDIVTTPSAVGDINGALQTLPGTTQNGNDGRLFVRGGDASETQTFIDGTVVQNPFGSMLPNIPTRGRFSPFLFKGTVFSTGAYSAKYGQALSGALILETVDMPDDSRGDISLMTVGGEASYTHRGENSSVAGKIGYLNLKPYQALVPQDIEWPTPPNGVSGEFIWRQKTSKTGLLKVYSSWDHNRSGIAQAKIENASEKQVVHLFNRFAYLNISYKESLSDTWMIKTGWAASRNFDALEPVPLDIERTEQAVNGKVVLIGELSPRVTLHSGAEWIGNAVERTIQMEEVRLHAGEFTQHVGALFTEGEMYFSNKWAVRLGLRAEYLSLSEAFHVAPRLSLAYKVDDFSQFSLAGGDFYQRSAADYLLVTRELTAEKARHYIVNYQRVKKNRTLRLEAYHKAYDRLVKFAPDGAFTPESYSNTGSGYARGLELFWRDRTTIKRMDYWVSYSLMDTERNFRDYPTAAMPPFAARHNASVVAKYFVTSLKTQFGASYSLASGRPYWNPHAERFLSDRTPPFQNLSINASYLIRQHIILYSSVSNVTGYRNVFGYEYSAQPDANGQYLSRPIGQPAPRFFFIGLFITLHKDKTLNQLDNL